MIDYHFRVRIGKAAIYKKVVGSIAKHVEKMNFCGSFV
jgi:hypothetical protein